MKSIALALFAAALVSCASTAPIVHPAPPVKVAVTADQAVRVYVRADTLVRATEDALRKYAPDAAPATLSIHFTSLGAADDAHALVDVRTYPDQQVTSGRRFQIISTNPLDEGVRQGETTTSAGPMRGGDYVRQVVKGTYTITDADGRVLERKAVYTAVDYHDGPGERLMGDQRRTAEYLARRVASLARSQS